MPSLAQTAAAALAALLFVYAVPAQAAQAAEPPLFGAGPLAVERSSPKVVGVYMPNWESPALLERLPAGSVSHVLYAFLRICGPGQLPVDAPKCEGRADFELGTGAVDKRFDAAFSQLKARQPHVKVLASVGGWGGSDPFFHLANEPARRAVFIASALRFLREHPGFDGIDIDWEHPGSNGAANGVALGSPADGQGYADLMTELRAGLNRLTAETGRLYLLSTALNTTSAIIDRINFRQAEQALDLVFMMSYDYYGGWSERVGHHSALRSSAPEADDSLERGVRNLRAAGVPASKLVAGVAMYGRGFSGVREPRTGATKKAAYPGAEGAMVYREIAARYLDRQGRGQRGFAARLDPVTQAWSLHHPGLQLYIGYDDPRAVLAKGRFVQEAGLAGVFAWELSQDNGDLLNAMNRGVGNLLIAPPRAKP